MSLGLRIFEGQSSVYLQNLVIKTREGKIIKNNGRKSQCYLSILQAIRGVPEDESGKTSGVLKEKVEFRALGAISTGPTEVTDELIPI